MELMNLRRGLLRTMANNNYRLLKSIVTESNVTGINIDIGIEAEEVIIAIFGKYQSGETVANLTVNLCNDSSYSQIGSNNKVFETNQFYNNNLAAFIGNIVALGNGYYITFRSNGNAINANANRMGETTAYIGGKFFDSAYPFKIRYLHIGSINNSVPFETGLKVNIFGR